MIYVEAGGKAISFRTSLNWHEWSTPIQLSPSGLEEVRFPAIAASGNVVHAIWMELAGAKYHMRYRGSADGGAVWSTPLTLSRPHAASKLITAEGFNIVSDDDQTCVTDDGRGTAHAVWAVGGGKGSTEYEVWHSVINWLVPGE